MLTPNQLDEVHATLARLPHVKTVEPLMASLLEPLVHHDTRDHRKGYSDATYTGILLGSQVGQRPSLRGAVEQSVGAKDRPSRKSPCRAQVYDRILDGKDAHRLRDIGTAIALEQVASYARLTGQWTIDVISDETFETATNRNRFLHKDGPKTTMGRRVQLTKQGRRIRSAFRNQNAPYNVFRDQNLLGVEHHHVIGRFPDGHRMNLRIYPAELGVSNAEYVRDMNGLAAQLRRLGITPFCQTLDARWCDTDSVHAASESPFEHFVIRAKEVGEVGPDPGKRSSRYRQRQKEAGNLPFTTAEWKARLWEAAVPHRRRDNVLVAATKTAPFQGWGDRPEITLAVGFVPKRGHRFAPGELLDLRVNMKPIFLFTSFEPTPSGAEEALQKLFERWDEEEDIKEYKSYRVKGSGGEPEMRCLQSQVAMIVENEVGILWKHSIRDDLREQEFMRYAYNKILKLFTAWEQTGGFDVESPCLGEPPPE